MYTLLTMRKESRIRPRGPEKLAVFLKTPESIHSRYIVSSHISYVLFFGTQSGLPTYFSHLLYHQIHAASSLFSCLKFLQTALSHLAAWLPIQPTFTVHFARIVHHADAMNRGNPHLVPAGIVAIIGCLALALSRKT